MKTLKESLFSKKNLEKYNPYGITEDDIKVRLEGFPIGVVIRMMEEQERQGNYPDVKVFQNNISSNYDEGGFDWLETPEGYNFWWDVINERDFNLFFEKYPDYKRYN